MCENMLSQAKNELYRQVQIKAKLLEEKFWKTGEGKKYKKVLEIAHAIETKEPYIVAVISYDAEIRMGTHPSLNLQAPNWIYRELNENHLQAKLALENYVETLQLQLLFGPDMAFDLATIQDGLNSLLASLLKTVK